MAVLGRGRRGTGGEGAAVPVAGPARHAGREQGAALGDLEEAPLRDLLGIGWFIGQALAQTEVKSFCGV